MKNRYAVIKLSIQHGEYSETSTSLHTITDDVFIDEYGRRHAEEFYPDATDDYKDETYYSNAGEVATKLISIDEVTKTEFELLKKYI